MLLGLSPWTLSELSHQLAPYIAPWTPVVLGRLIRWLQSNDDSLTLVFPNFVKLYFLKFLNKNLLCIYIYIYIYIYALYFIWTKGSQEPLNEVDSQSLVKNINRVQILWIRGWRNGLVVKVLDSQSRGSQVQNHWVHWVAQRLTQPFIFLRWMK